MNIRPFEIILIAVFAVSALGGLFYFRYYTPELDPTETLYGDSVEVWGTLDKLRMDSYFFKLSRIDSAFNAVHYKQIDKRAFQNELLNAIADGKSPDLVILPHELLVTYRSKLLAIPFDTLNERTFRETYIDGAEIFIRSDGTYGLPLAVDPLLMYWNRDIFSSSGIALPPKTWETLVSQTTRSINRVDDWLNFSQSTIAFGEYGNVTHAKSILSMLLLQTGNNIVTESKDGQYKVVLDRGTGESLPSGNAVLSFYIQFAHPSSDAYSWNRSKGMDRAEFLEGKLALYFGMGSERESLERDNANLNFDVTTVPQGSGITIQRNYGDFYALSIPRASKNANGAYAVARYLSDATQAKEFAEMFDFAPVQRALYSESTTDPFKSVLYQSALISYGWLDPDPQQSTRIFQAMVEDTLANQTKIEGTLTDARYNLESLFR